MTRKKIKHERIESESKRNRVFKQRSESLFKKADDLSILCGVQMGVIIKNPIENQTLLWPSPEVFWERLHKFYSFSDLERAKKMVAHETHLQQQLKDEQKLVLKFQKQNEEKEINVLMNELYMHGKNLHDLDMKQLSLLHKFSGEMLSKLKKRKEELDHDQRYEQPMPLSLPMQEASVGNYCQSYKRSPPLSDLPPPGSPVGGYDDQGYKQPLPISLPQPGSPVGGYDPRYKQSLQHSLLLTGAPVRDYGGVETSVFEKMRSDQCFMETMMEGQGRVDNLIGTSSTH